MGNLGHNVLDQVGKELRDDKLDFSSVDEKELEKRVDRAVELITSDYNGDLILNDEKSKYYVVQLARIMKRTVKTLGFQLSKGGFKIEDYELPFKKVYDIGDDDKIIFKGRIDRVDTYGSEEAGTEYVKITDYKSSSHDFSEDTMREGITLQLAMYMKNAIELLKERHSEKNVLPGAMLYYEIKDPFIESDKEFEENIRKELMPKGAIVNDQKVLEGLDKKLLEPSYISDVVRLETTKDAVLEKNKNAYSTEQFTNLLNEAEKKALSISKEIIHGKIDINPFVDKNVDACQYCPLKGLCGFDTRIRGYAIRTAEKKNAE